MEFTSGGLEQAKIFQPEEQMVKKVDPKREEFQWRPSPILCKRFDLIDPYMGKPTPVPRMRGKIDTLIFTADSVKATKIEETFSANRDVLPVSHYAAPGISKEEAENDNKVDIEVENVERPVDLYKAIFSDDSDNEEEVSILHQAKENSPKKVEAASSTLNRLIAGDFLESLGKELGLEVPPDKPYSMTKSAPGPLNPKPNEQALREEDIDDEFIKHNLPKSGSTPVGRDFSKKKYEEYKLDKVSRKVSSRRQQVQSDNSSSEYERSRKRSRRHKRRSSGSDSDLDNHSYRSESKESKRKYSKEKGSSSKKHSKHRSRDSPSRAHRYTEKEYSERRKEKRK